MPFTFPATDTRSAVNELVVRGRVLGGAHSGPGPVLVRTSDAAEDAARALETN